MPTFSVLRSPVIHILKHSVAGGGGKPFVNGAWSGRCSLTDHGIGTNTDNQNMAIRLVRWSFGINSILRCSEGWTGGIHKAFYVRITNGYTDIGSFICRVKNHDARMFNSYFRPLNLPTRVSASALAIMLGLETPTPTLLCSGL